MKKLSKEVKFEENSKIMDLIDGLLESSEGGNWNEYNDGDIVTYWYDFDDVNYSELLDDEDIKLDEVKEFIKEGICYVIDEDIWYNIRFEENEMIVEYEYVECD
jgi:hypothetical protein